MELIKAQMRYDRWKDERGGHYYLMGDLNVGNVDDERVHEEDGGFCGEYNELYENGVLSEESFFDPFLVQHSVDGTRTSREPIFLEKDVHNEQRFKDGLKKIEEPKGSFYLGADQKDRTVGEESKDGDQKNIVGEKPGKGGYGTKNFYKGSHPTIPNCRYDYILRLKCEDDYAVTPVAKFIGRAEIRHVLPDSEKIKTSPISDHAMVSAIFKKAKVGKFRK